MTDDHVRLSVCLSVCPSVHQDIYGTTRAIFTNLYLHVASGRGSLLLRHGDETQGEGAVLVVFLPNDNPL